MLHAVIMAGGTGTRFWPASRAACPKQLLDLLGGTTMIQATVQRLGDVVEPERVLVVTNRRLVDPIVEQLPELPAGAVIGEPCKRDTAPCIGLAAIRVSRNDSEATMIVMPADHVISPAERFQQSLLHAARLVEEQPTRIVTFGVRPTYASVAYGYIQRGEPLFSGDTSPEAGDSLATFAVARFHEKPQADVAATYCASSDFYWNSGIFVWKARTIMDALSRYEPEMVSRLETIAAASSSQFQQVLDREFPKIRGKSIDYAVMERASDVVVVEASFDWDDVGNWQSVARLCGTDDAGNTIAGKHLGIETTGSIVRSSDGHLIVTVGMSDCIVVHTPDATLVANKHEEELVRQVVKQLEEKGWSEFL